MKTEIKAFYIIAVMCALISTAAKAASSESLTARAMLIQMPAEKFQSLSTADSGTLKLPGAMDVIESLFTDEDTTLKAFSQLQVNITDKTSTCETKTKKNIVTPLRKEWRTDALDKKSMIENRWIGCESNFKITVKDSRSKTNSPETGFEGNCTFEYGWQDVIPFEKLEEEAISKNIDFIKADKCVKSKFACNSDISLKPGRTTVIGSQKIGGSYYVLLINISDK